MLIALPLPCLSCWGFFHIKQEKININVFDELITMDTKGDGSEKQQER